MIVRFPSAEVIATVARTYADRVRGLIGAPGLPEGQGMLFDMGGMSAWMMTMRGVTFPLDMIFIDDESSVIGIVAMAAPGSPGPYGIRAPSRYVLEVPGGWAARHHVRPGDRVTFA
jgi:uncharacterized membrane protein (UPF0127 family)